MYVTPLMPATPAESCIRQAKHVRGRQTVHRMSGRRSAKIDNVLSLPEQPLVQLDLHAAHELYASQAEGIHVGACASALSGSLLTCVLHASQADGIHVGACTSVLLPCLLDM